MRPSIRLRTSLGLSFAAMTAITLLALCLALASVLYIAHGQHELTQRYHRLINMNYYFSKQFEAYFRNPSTSAERDEAEESLKLLLAHTRAELDDEVLGEMLEQVQESFDQYFYNTPANIPVEQATQHYQRLREQLIKLQQQTLITLESHAAQAQQHSFVFALVLALSGVVILLVGFLAVKNMTRRISRPLEALALCADQIGHGNFAIELPTSRIHEFASLSRRVAAMAEALRQFKESDMQALTLGKQRLQAVLDSIDDGLLILDLQGRLQHLNPIALSQLQCNREVLGQRVGDALAHAQIDEQVQCILRGQSLDQAPADLAIQTLLGIRLLAYRITPITHANGMINGAVIVLHDVTQERAFAKLRQDFILRASHELRTPATGMQMAFGLLRERVRFDEHSREADLFKTIQAEMQRLIDLISDLLNFSRYQNGQHTLNLASCDVVELIQRSVQVMQDEFNHKHVQLAQDIPKALPQIMLDEQLISRVLQHLLNNAIRHSPSGGNIRLQVRQQGHRLIVSVENHGPAIAFDQQLRIFEPFVQIGPKRGGVGLGLALCKEIIQLHGGRIGVHSTPESGTQFYFVLPLVPAKAVKCEQ